VAQPFFFFEKKPNKSNKIWHHKTAKNKFKLGRKKKQITKTPPTLKQKNPIKSDQPCFIKIQKLIVKIMEELEKNLI
jgi:hypothetical protein